MFHVLAETVMEFNTFQAWIHCGRSILVHKYSNQNTSAIQQYTWPIPQEVTKNSPIRG